MDKEYRSCIGKIESLCVELLEKNDYEGFCGKNYSLETKGNGPTKISYTITFLSITKLCHWCFRRAGKQLKIITFHETYRGGKLVYERKKDLWND